MNEKITNIHCCCSTVQTSAMAINERVRLETSIPNNILTCIVVKHHSEYSSSSQTGNTNLTSYGSMRNAKHYIIIIVKLAMFIITKDTQ